MFLSIAAKGPGADSLSHIIQKHPGKLFERDNLKLFFPVYEPERANFVAMVEFPEYKLWNADTLDADAYVTSREYALSSLTCREIKTALNTAINGKYKDDGDRAKAETPLDLVVEALPIVTKLTDDEIRDLLKPLGYSGYEVETKPGEIVFPRPTMLVDHSYRHAWMPQKTRVLGLTLKCKKTLREVLRHLLVLIPVLDNYTHYTDLDTLVEELKNYGEGWLDSHPKKELITKRFLRHSKKLIKEFDGDAPKQEGEMELEKRINLGEMRIEWFINKVKASGLRSAVDAGCGSGRLAEALLKAGTFEVNAFDCHAKAVFTATKFLKGKGAVFFSSLMYRDDRLLNKDVFCLQEVIEHMPEFQLGRALDLIFGVYRPKLVLMSTPNREYNKVWGIPEGQFRHRGHLFEFDSAEAADFMAKIGSYGYNVQIEGIGKDYVPHIKPVEGQATAQGGGSVAVAQEVVTLSVPEGITPTFGFVCERFDGKSAPDISSAVKLQEEAA